MFSNRSVTSYALNGFLRAFVRPAMLKAARNGDFATLRKDAVSLGQRFSKMPKDVTLVDGQFDSIPVTWLSSRDVNRNTVMLYLHGGGFVMPPLMAHLAFCARAALAERLLVALPHYRLAPEHPFPAAPDDCFSAYKWLLEHGYAAENIVFAGDSAGGNLVFSTLMLAKQAGLPMPAGAVVMSPALKLDGPGLDLETSDLVDPMFSLETLTHFRSAYLQGDVSPDDIRLTPFVGDLSGLPPLQIYVGEAELLKADSLEVAERARAAGVSVDLHLCAGMPHIFPLIDALPESASARESMYVFFRNCLAKQAAAAQQ